MAGWVRKFDRHKKLNDEVENVPGSLSWRDKAEEYFRLLDAAHNSQAVEDSIAADDFAADRMLREHGRSIGNKVAEQNLTTIKARIKHCSEPLQPRSETTRNTAGAAVVPETFENAENGD